MNYRPHIDAVIGIARAEGCRVEIKNVSMLPGGYAGTFYAHAKRPRIELAVGYPQHRTIFLSLVHEFMHFRQQKSGVPDAVKNLRSGSLNRTLMCEYEAEKMTVWFLIQYELPNFIPEKYIVDANRYMQVIKWERLAKTNRIIEYPGRVKSVKVPSTWWTDAELIEPLSASDIKTLDRYWARYERGKI